MLDSKALRVFAPVWVSEQVRARSRTTGRRIVVGGFGWLPMYKGFSE